MKKALLKIFFLIFACILFAMSGYCQSSFAQPLTQQQIDLVQEADSNLFAAIFDDCNTSNLENMLTEDFEFYHDKWGQVAQSANEFISGISANCEAQKNGHNPRAKRILDVDASLFFPITNYGVLQNGSHDFYQMKDGSFQFTERAQFSHLWKFENEKWKLSRVISYDHKPERI